MAEENKYFETGSNPYHLNLNNTAKEFSVNELTNPSFGLLDSLTKHIFFEDNLKFSTNKREEEEIFNKIFLKTNVENITAPNIGFAKAGLKE